LPADHKVYGAGSGSLSLSYTSVWSGALDRFWPLPRSVDHPEYENNIGYNPTYFPQSPYQNQHCYYRCADDYHSEDEGVTCISDYRTAACVPASLGGNFSYYNNLSSYSITQHYDGTLWLPTLTGSYMATSTSGSCNYSCRQGFHSVDNGTTCESDIRNALCSGYPENSIPNTASGIVQYWVNNGWSPTNIVSYNNTSSSSECYFKCKTNYDWSGATLSCEPRKIFTACAGLPAGAHWNTASGIIQTWNGSGWSPSLTGSWNQTGSTTECRYDCDVGQAYNPGLGLCTCLISGTFFTHDFSWVPYDERLWYTSLDIGKELSDNSFTNFISVQLPDAYSGSLIPLIGKAWSHAT
jgi:hypothetical protein